MAAVKLAPPSKVKIGASVWRVWITEKLLEADGGYMYGRSSPSAVSIELHATQDRQQMRDTLLHEVMHGIVSNIPLFENPGEEERVLRSLTPWLLAVLRENKALTDYLVEK